MWTVYIMIRLCGWKCWSGYALFTQAFIFKRIIIKPTEVVWSFNYWIIIYLHVIAETKEEDQPESGFSSVASIAECKGTSDFKYDWLFTVGKEH